MSIRAVHLVVLCGLVGLAAAVFAAGSRRASGAWSDRALLAYVPPSASFVLTADIEALRHSDLGALVPGGERDLPGVGKLSSVCGFDPTAQVHAIAVALSASRAHVAGDELGVVAGGDFRARAIADCARKVISRRQGRPRERRLGDFTLLSGAGQGILAMREHGPVLLGDESVLHEMIRASERHTPGTSAPKLHARLRQAMGPAPLVATWRPSPARPAESDALLDELGPLSYATGVAVALRVEPAPSLEALVLCESLEKCSELAMSLSRAGRLLLTELLPSPPGAGDIEVTVANRQLRLRLAMGPRELAALLGSVAQRL
ncbi:MAG: hypothetical protein JW940_30985 [Polyangiaceae bacterium]|nr:hypothetical protein [Polyangiaceae bacterium]